MINSALGDMHFARIPGNGDMHFARISGNKSKAASNQRILKYG